MKPEWITLAGMCSSLRPGRVVARLDAGELDHAAFRARVAAWRDGFRNVSGLRVALYFEDAIEFAAALFGVWHAGKGPFLCANALPETLVRLASEVDAFAGDFPADLPGRIVQGAITDDQDQWPELDEEAARLVLYTSGSTGASTAIAKHLRQLVREVEALETCFGKGLEASCVVGTVSHQHIYGLLFRVLWPLAAGRPIGRRLFFHEEIVAAITAATVLVSSPAHLKRIPTTLDWSAAKDNLRAIFSSGGALPVSASTEAGKWLGQVPIEIYGSSESGGIAWRQGDMGWTPLPGVSWRIVDDRLEVSSAHLPDGDHWLGADRVEADPAGGFRLLGRADRIVKVEERRVSLTELEHQLQALPEVVEARVVLLEQARIELAAVIVLSALGRDGLARNGRRVLGQHLFKALAQAQDAVTRPRRWRFVESLPMNAQGKTTEAALRALFHPERPLPHWLEREPEHACVELELVPELVVFDGHFPQAPILPGVAQIDWAIRFGREAFDLPARFRCLEALKFHRVLQPGMRVRLMLDWHLEKRTLVFRYESEHGVHASGRAVFEPGDSA